MKQKKIVENDGIALASMSDIQSEHELQKACVRKLRAHNYLISCNDVFNGISFIRDIKSKSIYKKHMIAMGGVVGFPDITIFKESKLIFVEFKFGNGKLSYDQEIIHNQLRSRGYEVVIWKTLDDCISWIVKDLN